MRPTERTYVRKRADEVRYGDVLVARENDNHTWVVTGTKRKRAFVTIETLSGKTFRVLAGYECRLLDVDPACDGACVDGFYVAGAIVNGKLPVRGECFRCKGKGYQTRVDRLRNAWYDRVGRRVG